VARRVTAAAANARTGALASLRAAVAAGETGAIGLSGALGDLAPEVVTPESLGASYEALLGEGRRTSGAFYTPAAVVDFVLDRTLEPLLDVASAAEDPEAALLALRLCDPACGAGAFLLAAARRLAARLVTARGDADVAGAAADVACACVLGAESDPVTVAVCRAALALDAGGDARVAEALGRHIVCADALLYDWTAGGDAPVGFDAVVGNPPFLNRLESATAPDRSRAVALLARYGAPAARYADAATLFLLLAAQLTRAGGRFALVQPMSLLAAQDARATRTAVLADASLTALWFSASRVFDANVEVVVAAFERRCAETALVERWAGPGFTPLPPREVVTAELATAETWAPLVAAALEIPEIVLRTEHVLGEYCEATADFRDQYYGLVPAIVEFGAGQTLADPRFADGSFAPLVTTALVDLAHCAWGQRSTRFAKQQWAAPAVDMSVLAEEAALARWAALRRVPKVLLATQTRALEVAVDEAGVWLPSVPLVTVVPRDPARLWHVAAALASPHLSAWAAARYLGTALRSDRIKLAARQVATLPAPAEGAAWDAAAAAFRAATAATDPDARSALLGETAEHMAAAFGVRDADLTRWWAQRVR